MPVARESCARRIALCLSRHSSLLPLLHQPWLAKNNLMFMPNHTKPRLPPQTFPTLKMSMPNHTTSKSRLPQKTFPTNNQTSIPSHKTSRLHQVTFPTNNQISIFSHTTSHTPQKIFYPNRHSLRFRLRMKKSTWQSVWQVSTYEPTAEANPADF